MEFLYIYRKSYSTFLNSTDPCLTVEKYELRKVNDELFLYDTRILNQCLDESKRNILRDMMNHVITIRAGDF